MAPYLQLVTGKDGSNAFNATVSQPLFLYEISQLSDKNESRASQLRDDLQDFLDLEQPISQMIWFKPGRNHSSVPAQKTVNRLKIDICQSQYGKQVDYVKRIDYVALVSHLLRSDTQTLTLGRCNLLDDIRDVLMRQAVNASLWIRQYFVKSPTVKVSSKDYFVEELMTSWERDPCVARRQAAVTQ